MRRSPVLVLPLVPLLAAAACDAPRTESRSAVFAVLERRAAQTFHAVPPEVPTVAQAGVARRGADSARTSPTRAARDSMPAPAAMPAAAVGPAPSRILPATVIAIRLPPPAALVLHGRVVNMEAAPVAGARVILEEHGTTRDAVTDEEGRYLVAGAPPGESPRLRVQAPVAQGLHTAAISLRAGVPGAVTVVLLPRSWRVRGGRYDGAIVPLLPLTGLSPDRATFARLADARVVGWPSRLYPLRVSFVSDFEAADTASFWAAARDLERDIGRRLFTPAVGATDSLPEVLVRAAPDLRNEAITYTTRTGGGELFAAEVQVRHGTALRRRTVVAHELLHVLGVGHTAAWLSVVAPSGAPAPEWITRDDVAWIQLLLALRELQEREGVVVGW